MITNSEFRNNLNSEDIVLEKDINSKIKGKKKLSIKIHNELRLVIGTNLRLELTEMIL